MELRDSESTRKVWPHAFSLQLKTAITVDPITKAQLVQELRVKNLNPVDGFYFTNALHSYFAISDITSTGLLGLKSNSYIDRVHIIAFIDRVVFSYFSIFEGKRRRE